MGNATKEKGDDDDDDGILDQLMSVLLMHKHTDPTTLRTTLLKAYRLFVTPTTAKTVPRTTNPATDVLMGLAEAGVAFGAPDLPPDAGRTFAEIAEDRGYLFAEHVVETSDGFRLTMHRVPSAAAQRNAARLARRPVVFLMHALLDSSDTFIDAPEGLALAFVLADAGFDVWLGNSRGNKYGRSHVTLAPDSPRFWEWSWDEIALIDIPALLRYILSNRSDVSQVNYIGYSQGSTAALACFSSLPQVAAKVKILIALAPVTTLTRSKSNLVRAFKGMTREAKWLQEVQSHELAPASELNGLVASGCAMFDDACKRVISKVTGGHAKNLDSEALPIFLAHTPSGTSIRNIAHWIQLATTECFCKFRNASEAVEKPYHLSKSPVPLAVFYGGRDKLMPPGATEELVIAQYTHVLFKKKVVHYGHLDFVFGSDVDINIHHDVLTLLNAKNGLLPPSKPRSPTQPRALPRRRRTHVERNEDDEPTGQAHAEHRRRRLQEDSSDTDSDDNLDSGWGVR